jgi:hypothetical protein
MANDVSCRCPGDCGQHDGICGNPVETPLDVADVVNGKEQSPYKTGVCDASFKALKAAGRA